MPSMIKSPRSRELTGTLSKVLALVSSAFSSGPAGNRGFKLPPPWGETSFDNTSSFEQGTGLLLFFEVGD